MESSHIEQAANPLDCINFLDQLRQNCGLIPASGSHLEHLGGNALCAQRRNHAGDHPRLRYCLSVTNWQGGIVISTAGKAFIHEKMTRIVSHLAKNSFQFSALCTLIL